MKLHLFMLPPCGQILTAGGKNHCHIIIHCASFVLICFPQNYQGNLPACFPSSSFSTAANTCVMECDRLSWHRWSYFYDLKLFRQMIVLPPTSAMPRSFLVKRGGIHFLRTAERSPSPGCDPLTFGDLRKQTGSSDTSLEDSATETPDTNLLPITLLQQDIPAATHTNGNVHSRVFNNESYIVCRSRKYSF